MHLLTALTTLLLPFTIFAYREVSKPGDWTTSPGVGQVDPLVKRADPVELSQNVPEKRNTHKEFVPTFRKTQSNCDCAPAVCPPNRMTSESISHCEASHAWACWKRNAACPKPEVAQKNKKGSS